MFDFLIIMFDFLIISQEFSQRKGQNKLYVRLSERPDSKSLIYHRMNSFIRQFISLKHLWRLKSRINCFISKLDYKYF